MADEKPRKVLIVDDEESVRELLRMTFARDEDFDIVAEAEDGVEALSKALEHRPDYVVLDYSMPRMNGEEAARVLKAMQPGVCILAFSAIVSEQPEWADGFLSKEHFNDLIPLLRKLDSESHGRLAG